MNILVLGLGNELLTDDRIGLLVARRAKERLAKEPDVSVRETGDMGLALLDEIAGTDAVVLVDSIETGRAEPGHLQVLEEHELGTPRISPLHFLSVADTLSLGRRLGLAMPTRVIAVAIEIRRRPVFGTELSAAVAAALEPAADLVCACVAACRPVRDDFNGAA